MDPNVERFDKYVRAAATTVVRLVASVSSSDTKLNVLCTPESLKLPLKLSTKKPPYVRMVTLEEIGARLLCANVRWALDVPSFSSLPFEVQNLLWKKRWSELLVLSLTMVSREVLQSYVLPLMGQLIEMRKFCTIIPTLTYRIGHESATEPDRLITEAQSTIDRIKSSVPNFNDMQITDGEYAHLRALCLFSPDNAPEHLVQMLERIQYYVLRSLNANCRFNESRMINLIIKLPDIKNFSAPILKLLLRINKIDVLENAAIMDRIESNTRDERRI